MLALRCGPALSPQIVRLDLFAPLAGLSFAPLAGLRVTAVAKAAHGLLGPELEQDLINRALGRFGVLNVRLPRQPSVLVVRVDAEMLGPR